MMETYTNITKRVGNKPVIKGHSFIVMEECENDYHKDLLPKVPAGTVIVADFAGAFGMYGIAEVDGVIHKVKIHLHELHRIDFVGFDARKAVEV